MPHPQTENQWHLQGARWLHRCPLQSRAPGSPVAPALWLILATLLFFLAPSHLYASRLCQLLGAVKSQWVLGVVFWNLVASPTLPLPARGTLSRWGAGSACGMGWCSKMKLLFLHFCVVILLCVCVCVCVCFWRGEAGGLFCSLLYCIAEASEANRRALPSCYCSCIANLSGGMLAGVFHPAILVTHLPNTGFLKERIIYYPRPCYPMGIQ